VLVVKHVQHWNTADLIVSDINTNTDRIYIARLTNCPGALTNVKKRDGIDEFLKDFLTLLMSVVSLILSGKDFQAAGPAWLKHRSPNLVRVRRSSVGGPQTGSTTGFSDSLHRVSCDARPVWIWCFNKIGQDCYSTYWQWRRCFCGEVHVQRKWRFLKRTDWPQLRRRRNGTRNRSDIRLAVEICGTKMRLCVV